MFDAGPRQLRIGAGVGVEYHTQDVEVDFFGTVNEDLLVITPEVILSWRQPIGAEERWYVEPGVGVGAAIGIIDVAGSESGAGYSVRPFVRGGYQMPRWSFGIEAGYRFGQLDFGFGSEDFSNIQVGAFFNFRG